MAKEYLVRLRPYNEHKGFRLRKFLAFGLRFEEGKRWYRVPEVVVRWNEDSGQEEEINVIDYLRKVRNDNDREESPLAFDVCTPEEARAIDDEEKKAKEAAAARAENPHPVDLVSSEKRGAPEQSAKRGPGRPRKARPEVTD